MKKALEILYAELRDINESIRFLPYLSNNKNHLEENKKYVEEAIKELEELENRSCDSCKQFEEINDRCNKGVMTNWKHEINCSYCFYCSSWESKC